MKQLTPIVKYALILIAGLVLGALLFNKCNGAEQQPTEVTAELKKQYEGLQSEYINLQNRNTSIGFELKKVKAELITSKEDQKKALINYGKTYTKGRDVIIHNPKNDSIHLAAYDSLNAECVRTQLQDQKVIDQWSYLSGVMQTKINNQDSTLTNRNAVIALDKISIAVTRDSLISAKKEIKSGKKKVVKSFFIGVGVGVALKEAVDVGIKLFGK